MIGFKQQTQGQSDAARAQAIVKEIQANERWVRNVNREAQRRRTRVVELGRELLRICESNGIQTTDLAVEIRDLMEVT